MTESLLPSVEILTGPAPTHVVIWLHGLGADGHDFEPVVDEFDADCLPPTRFIFPHAPKRAVTINAGYVMRAWFDIYSRDYGNRAEDVEGTEASAAQVEALIARENARGIPDERIVLAGFSQGGAIALHAGLRHPQRLAGVMALSTFLPLAERLAGEAHPANRDVPIFMAHGQGDSVIPHDFARQSAELLSAAGYQQYETSAYAKPGFQCHHNLNYWRFGDYLGIGCGAHGKITFPDGRILRTAKTRHPRGYMEGRYLERQHDVEEADKPFEFFMNRFRLLEAAPRAEFSLYTGLDEQVIRQQIDAAIAEGYLLEDAQNWQITEHGKLFLNSLLELFLSEE